MSLDLRFPSDEELVIIAKEVRLSESHSVQGMSVTESELLNDGKNFKTIARMLAVIIEKYGGEKSLMTEAATKIALSADPKDKEGYLFCQQQLALLVQKVRMLKSAR